MTTYSEYLSAILPGIKVQKISVNTGMGCPNRDGTLGTGGCVYCDNTSFTPSYCMDKESVGDQLERGKIFFSKKYPDMRYLAYFQSFTSTYTSDLSSLETMYREALSVDGVVGIVIGTRPDTLPEPVLDLLGRISADVPVFLEIGAETACDDTLRLINRGHTWAQVCDAVERAVARGLHVGLHLIAGLPGEDGERVLANVREAARLPIETLKLHQLQVIRDTPLHRLWESGQLKVEPLELEEYLDLCVRILRELPEHIVVERFLAQAPPGMVVAPKWGLKNYQFMNLLQNRLAGN